MRKVRYTIDDYEYFKRIYKEADNIDDILKDIKPFRVIYTLIDENNGNTFDRYELTDFDGNRLNINDLNGYQKAILLDDCIRHFTGREPQYEGGYMFERAEVLV